MLKTKTLKLIQSRGIFTPATPATNEAGQFWKITLTRSPIGLNPQVRENVRALGFKRRGNVVYRSITNELAGKILKIKEIVKVELVGKAESLKTPAANGFEVIGRMNPQIAPGSKAAKPLLPLRKREEPSFVWKGFMFH